MLDRVILAGMLLLSLEPGGGTDSEDLQQFQYQMLESGAHSIVDAVNSCQEHFGAGRIPLPIELPPVEFTHLFGQCMDTGSVEPHLDIQYIHSSKPENEYHLEVYPAGHGPKLAYLPFTEVPIDEDTLGRYYQGPDRSLQLLTYTKGKWQYLLSSSYRPESKIEEKHLTSIAKSHIRYVKRTDPAYAQWGAVAIKETGKKYGMDVVDYLYMGRKTLSRDLAEEKFKLWLRKGNREFGVYVTVRYHPATRQLVSIVYEEA
ncbi:MULTISPECIES: DUF3889 domain-containing protein [Paenibacillus]|uniref:Uncharacterized protein n=2 Tax=Paenibacillus lactis TaxID=228574 RepID=G4HJL5_9BACL|nr:DUF3889 domain-containing protein [Paenibacillus lactis]EHB62469.1 hypothetical protein PaelaDRAFT_4212 [Paenibacillus lactis 154]MBP1895888.1 hypothetical protein [Paenibacillus lactis]GIO90248.1 hypothetical protein J31TS3_14750 [Paenibacillus lactis]